MDFFKMRQKVIFAILIPLIFFSSIWFFYSINEIRNYLYIRHLINAVTIFEKFGDLVNGIQREKEMTLIFKSFNQTKFDILLKKVQKQNDKKIKKILQSVNQSTIELQNYTLSSLFQPSLRQLFQLNGKRRLFATLSELNSEEISRYYNGIINQFLNGMNDLIRKINEPNVRLLLTAYLNLLQEQLAAGRERRSLYQALSAKKFDSENYRKFIMGINGQNVFQQAFMLEFPNYKDYIDFLKSPVRIKIEDIRNRVLKQGDFNIDPEHWWSIKTQEIKLLNNVRKQLHIDIIKQINYWNNLNLFNIIISFVLLSSGIILTLYLLRSKTKIIGKNLEVEVSKINELGNDISDSVNITSEATQLTAQAVNGTSLIIEHLKVLSQLAAKQSDTVTHVSNQALTFLEASERSLNATFAGMHEIMTGMKVISTSIEKLSEYMNKIRNMIETVDDLAEQSHLLAVSASIESSQAGEYGKGFTIIAQEIRTLAEKSKQTTLNVQHLLNDIQNASSAAVMATEVGSAIVQKSMNQSAETNKLLKSILKNISDITRSAEKITFTNKQQFTGIDQVVVSVMSIMKATQFQTSNMDQVKELMKRLHLSRQSLNMIIENYKI